MEKLNSLQGLPSQPSKGTVQEVKLSLKNRNLVLSILTDEEELCLVQWAKSLVKVGFPATDSDLLDQVQRLLIKDRRKNPFENRRPTRGWLQKIKKKYPELTQNA